MFLVLGEVVPSILWLSSFQRKYLKKIRFFRILFFPIFHKECAEVSRFFFIVRFNCFNCCSYFIGLGLVLGRGRCNVYCDGSSFRFV